MAQGTRSSRGVILFRYLSRLYDTIASRDDIEIESLNIPQPDQVLARLSGRVRFLDGTLLDFEEEVRAKAKRGIEKVHYSYHYQHANGATIFRYDNAPHHRKIKSFPHHKHVGAKIEASAAPDLHEVLQEIERYLDARRAR
ncbi:MAG: hypothetical protein HZC40_24070 [Chloroflexi bacterium]|nr:hypothetical protein [Chloroflexota bacterium]